MKKQDFKNLVEPFIYENLKYDNYEVYKMDPINLLTWNRFDLAFKLFYLDYKAKNNQLALQVYREDIKSQTLGSFEEFGKEEKDTFAKYILEFEKTFYSIKKNGFRKDETVIPLSEANTILNGAHRVASAIYLHKEVSCVKLDLPIMTCDYKYFYERNVPVDVLDMVATKFIEYSENTYIAFLWPSGAGNNIEAESKFSNIVYKKKIKLTPTGGFNLLYELYAHMDWVGSKIDGYRGIQQKLVECFPCFESFTVIVFQSESLEKVRMIKEQVREIHNIGFSSIHITDTKEEAIRVSRLILNENGLHFLNYAKPKKYKSTYNKIEKFKSFIEKNEATPNEILLDSGIVLSIYGLRESCDIDYFIDDNSKIKYTDKEFEYHDEELKYHNEEKFELIYNPRFYFYFDDLKFISFAQLYKMKKNRNGEKDINDCKIMEALIENNAIKKKINQIKQSFFYFKIKAKKNIWEFIFNVLRKTRLYYFTRIIYRKLRGRK